MGLFLQTAIILNCDESTAKTAVEKAEKIPGIGLMAPACQYKEFKHGVNIQFNEECDGFETLAKELSREVNQPVMLLYIHDEDYWGYDFYDNGKAVDSFNPMPDLYEEVSEQERERLAGKSAVIANYFQVDEAKIKNYLVAWTEDILENTTAKAYEDDEFEQCNCWQMADFMRKLGYPYEW